MKKAKKLFGMLFIMVALVCVMTLSASAVPTSGIIGNARYSFTSYGNATIYPYYGDGAMCNFDNDSPMRNFVFNKIIIKDGVSHIGNFSFLGCGVNQVEISNSVKSIGYAAFCFTKNLKEIIIPESVISISTDAFRESYDLEKITLLSGFVRIYADAFYKTAYYNNEENWENGLLYLDKYLIASKPDISGDITVKDGTLGISDEVFKNRDNLTNIVIPDGVKYIGNECFYDCDNLTSIEIPNSVTELGDNCFSSCGKLTKAIISGNINDLGREIFSGCSNLKDVTLSEGLEMIGVSMFESCKKLTNIVIPNSVKYINFSAFAYCYKLENITFSENLETIRSNAFESCILENIKIPDSVTTIEKYAFYRCTTENLELGKNITSFEFDQFNYGLQNVSVSADNSVFTSVDGVVYSKDKKTLLYYPGGKNAKIVFIPAGTEIIAPGAFLDTSSYSYGLDTVIIPKSVTKCIGAFPSYWGHEYESIKSYHYIGTEEEWNNIGGDGVGKRPVHYITESEYPNTKKVYCTECCWITENSILGHSFTNYISNNDATCIANGTKTAKCDNECNLTNTVKDYGSRKGHSFTNYISDNNATCTKNGTKTAKCDNNCGLTDTVTDYGSATGHSYEEVIYNPTCTENGYIEYTCHCGRHYTETIEATGHDFEGSKCKNCPFDKATECSCNCHAGGIKTFFFSIINFFQKLFGQNKLCACGANH